MNFRTGALACAIVASAVVLSGCDGDGGDGEIVTASCHPDPMKTGLVAQQTGISADAFDCDLLKWSANFGEPDPLIFKSIIYNESRFDDKSVGCTNMPCGTPMGWSADETGCYGLMQVVPACVGTTNQPCLLANGQPNLTMDEKSAEWSSSVFNPSINIEVGIGGFAYNRAQVVTQFRGCTEDQYTLMALGNYANYGTTTSCTQFDTDYVNIVLATYHTYAKASGYIAHDYP